MPRVARIVVPGLAHHVIQRGNNRQDVFFTTDDRRVYLRLLEEHADACGLRVLGYCLMTNHVHLVVVPRREDALAGAIGRTHFLYTQYINRLHGRSGHLWQGRFYSCPMDEVHTWQALRYVERNPVRARLVRLAWRYPWSSAAAHCGDADGSGLLNETWWRAHWRPGQWRKQLRQGEDDAMTLNLRRSIRTGRPLASDRLISRLESRLGRRLRALPIGRPKKQVATRFKTKVKRSTSTGVKNRK